MESKKIIAIIAVVVVVAAAVAAAVVLTKNDDKKDYYSDNTDCRLQILGNADENDYLDSNDVDKINEMIAEEKYSVWADANHDEKVDASDAEFVQKVLDLKKANKGKSDADKQSTTIYYQNIDGKIVTGVYPVLKYILVNTQRGFDAAAAAGVQERIVAINDYAKQYGCDGNPIMYSYYKNLPSVGDRKTPDLEEIEKISADTVIAGTSGTYLKNIDANAVKVGTKNVLRLGTWENGNMTTGALMLGFFCDSDEKAQAYVKWMDDIDKKVADVLEGISDKDKTKFLNCSSATYFGAQSDGISSALTKTGATNVGNILVTDKTKSGGYVKDYIEAITANNPDYILVAATISKSLTDKEVADKYDAYISNGDGTGYSQKLPTITAVTKNQIYMIDYYLPFSLVTLIGTQYLFGGFDWSYIDDEIKEYLSEYTVAESGYTFNSNHFYYAPSSA